MPIDLETIVLATQTVNQYGHVADDGDLDALAEVFTGDAVFDQRPVGGVRQEGLAAIRAFFATAAGPDRPMHSIAHHATNVVVYEQDGRVRSRCKFLAIDGKTGQARTGDYDDVLTQEDGVWKIAERVVSLRTPTGDS